MRYVDACFYDGIIVPAPSGVVWENQTHGCACQQSSLEGVLIPCSVPTELIAYMYRRGEICPLAEEEADQVDWILEHASLPLRCCRDRIGAAAEDLDVQQWSGEAWLWVESRDEPMMGLAEFDHFRGVMTWTNSD